MTRLAVCKSTRNSRCIRRAESQLKVGLVVSFVIHIPVYRADGQMQDILQHYPDRRLWWALAILDHVVGAAHPWGESRV